jgi:hypothetical protein
VVERTSLWIRIRRPLASIRLTVESRLSRRAWSVVMVVFTILTPLDLLGESRPGRWVWWLSCLSIAALSADGAFAPDGALELAKPRPRSAFERAVLRTFWGFVARVSVVVVLLALAGVFSIRSGHQQASPLGHLVETQPVWHILIWTTVAGEVVAAVWLLMRLLSRQAANLPPLRPLINDESRILIASLLGTNALVDPVPIASPISSAGFRGFVALYAFTLASGWQRRLQPELRKVLKGNKAKAVHEWMIGPWRASRPKHARRSALRGRTPRYVGGIVAISFIWLSYFAGFASAGADLVAPSQQSIEHVAPPIVSDPVSGTPAESPNDRSDVDYSQVCGSSPQDLPGWGAPETAVSALSALWLGSDNGNTIPNGIGAVLGGCPQPATSVVSDGDTSTYQVGVSGGQIESVGVTSPQLGTALFLSDGNAAEIALGLLRKGVPIGGSDRINVGNGDVQAIYSPSGTTLLIRPVLHPTGQLDTSEPFIELSPPESAAWFEASTVLGAFLWPTAIANGSGGQTVDLSEKPYGGTAASIVAASSGSGVSLEIGGKPATSPASPTSISMAEVTALPASSG